MAEHEILPGDWSVGKDQDGWRWRVEVDGLVAGDGPFANKKDAQAALAREQERMVSQRGSQDPPLDPEPDPLTGGSRE